ncbi:MAG: enoyl-CoA hydratase/isomerase family protein [Acidobacteria bacterium]|nr:enoyl-CoA hydratase/isomerase family protein [Acidobacteriota bacterium]
MKSYSTLNVRREGAVLNARLNRIDVRNAFNDELIGEGIELFDTLARDPDGIRAVVLGGEGSVFCAGADLNWMAKMVAYGRDENIADSSKLAKLFAAINECPLPVIGRIQGAAIGGGVGLVAVCDVAIATADAKFGLAEVKLGILPAVISPYVIAKIGATHARALFLTGERFDSARALQIGLVHEVVAGEEALDAAVARVTGELMSSGPDAVRECKRLIDFVSSCEAADAVPYTIEAIAERRVSDEGQAGMTAFLEKRKAPWVTG